MAWLGPCAQPGQQHKPKATAKSHFLKVIQVHSTTLNLIIYGLFG
jgi:hypothetical protein